MSDEATSESPKVPLAPDRLTNAHLRTAQTVAERVLEHYEHPYHRGACVCATHGTTLHCPLCGDRVRIELVISSAGTVDEAWFAGQGCVISQAAASMLVQQVESLPLNDVRQFSAQDLLELFRPGLSPGRQKCCLLPWRALQQALDCPLAYDVKVGTQPFGGPGHNDEP